MSLKWSIMMLAGYSLSSNVILMGLANQITLYGIEWAFTWLCATLFLNTFVWFFLWIPNPVEHFMSTTDYYTKLKELNDTHPPVTPDIIKRTIRASSLHGDGTMRFDFHEYRVPQQMSDLDPLLVECFRAEGYPVLKNIEHDGFKTTIYFS